MNESVFQQEQKEVIAAYSHRLLEHGRDVRTLNWGSRTSQEKRFEVIAEVGIEGGMSVLDVGCGLGDFQAWSRSRGLELDYHGIDVTEGMIGVCRDRFPECEFATGDIVTWNPNAEATYDFVFAS